MTKSKILRRLALVAPPVIRAISKPGPCCVMASAIGQMVLEEFGVASQPMPVELSVCNRAWADWAAEGYPGGQDEQLRRGAHLLTNAPDWQGGALPNTNPPTGAAWDGHLALRLDDLLIDLDMAAMSRPAKSIVLPTAFVGTLTERVMVYRVGSDRESYAQYSPLVAPYADDYRTSRDWTERWRYAEQVARIVRDIKKYSLVGQKRVGHGVAAD